MTKLEALRTATAATPEYVYVVAAGLVGLFLLLMLLIKLLEMSLEGYDPRQGLEEHEESKSD
jgi:hypothetical protein